MSRTAFAAPLAVPSPSSPSLFLHDPPSLPRIEQVDRSGPLLHRNPLGGPEEVLCLNLTRGCVQRCPFCTVRAHSGYRGDDVVFLFRDTAQQLDQELAQRRRLPRAVYLSPSADPFPPVGAIQAAAASVVEVLAARGVEAWFMTRGLIRPSVLQVLAAHRSHVRVTVALTTLDRTIQRALEPLAAPPRLRLRQIASLRELGIATQVALDPLVPGWTDSRANVRPLLEALAALGVRHVSAGYLFLRSSIAENLRQALGDERAAPLLAAFASGPILAAGSIAAARYLPKPYRQRGYAALMALGAELGITVGVSGTANPDFVTSRPAGQPRPLRKALFPILS